jgi:hypothetical protein
VTRRKVVFIGKGHRLAAPTARFRNRAQIAITYRFERGSVEISKVFLGVREVGGMGAARVVDSPP